MFVDGLMAGWVTYTFAFEEAVWVIGIVALLPSADVTIQAE